MPRAQSMLEGLAWAVASTRRRAQLPQHMLAIKAGVSPSTISRLERALAWPQDPTVIVAAVAEAAGVHEREVWLAAVHAWGEDPDP